MDLIWYLIEVALLVSAAQFILGPIAIYVINRPVAEPEYETFDPLDPPLPLPEDYERNVGLLEALGFKVVAHVQIFMTAQCVLTLLTNPSAKHVALVVHMLARAPLVRIASSYLEFCTDFEDGTSVITNNTRQAGVFAKVPEKKVYRLPHISDPNQLYKLHCALLAQEPARTKVLPRVGEEVTHIVTSIGRDLARQAELGLFQLNESGSHYRPTIMGAIVLTWKVAWPVGSIRRLIQRQRGKRMARTLLRANK